MPPELAALLSPGESVVWQGRPRPFVFILRGLPQIAFGLTWPLLGALWYYGSGGISYETSAFEGTWRLVPLLSIPFIIAGLSFWFYPIRLGLRANRTWYVVTNQRIFIAELKKGQSPLIRVFSSTEMAPPQLKHRRDGYYDLILTERAQRNPHLTPGLDAGFFGIVEGEGAAQAVRALVN